VPFAHLQLCENLAGGASHLRVELKEVRNQPAQFLPLHALEQTHWHKTLQTELASERSENIVFIERRCLKDSSEPTRLV